MGERNPQGWQVRVRGLVQGVGFRPAVWRLATESGLHGEVLNDGEGVLIHLISSHDQLASFLDGLKQTAPPLSRIDAVEIVECSAQEWDGFSIVTSTSGTVRTGIVPDATTCPDCLNDINDPKNRRFGYAFTNCTNCGPRLSITQAIPYDRANTAMSVFKMCKDCQREYDDPANRRFHAQPNACPQCGPRLTLVDPDGQELPGDALEQAAKQLREGNILAIKGLGGFQLACDATNAAAVTTLRQRKQRAAKPFALMARDLAQIEAHTHLSAVATAALTSAAAPIVLLPVRAGTALPSEIAPDQNRLGFMLPNTPLHHLLLQHLDVPLVMTSGNLSGEPQVSDNDAALGRLAAIADAWLLHDREIVNRLDDSVVQMVSGQTQILRRARGYAPSPLRLHAGFAQHRPILACGADLKNTFCLMKDGQAIVSQHMGDMENDRTHREFQHSLALYCETHDVSPETIAVDAHPGYFASRWGRDHAAQNDLPIVEVQHHHAHIAATLAEHGYGPDTPPVLGVVLDGLGFGEDETLWGGEIMLADFRGFKRLAHFVPVALPGGEKASQQPWRNLLAHLLEAFGPNALHDINTQFGALPVLTRLEAKPVDMVAQMIVRHVNAPLASSAGRLFDAVAAALGVCHDEIRFEGQAAMALQNLAESEPSEPGGYSVENGAMIHWAGLWTGVLSDLKANVPLSRIARRVHNTIASAVCSGVVEQSKTHGKLPVVLTGGVFQNRLLSEAITDRLRMLEFDVLSSQLFPVNDGGISLGQATIAAALSLRG
ncbi:carbamoyltransferase HypF [Alisedimentitalea sp. MJ-SS2]|uniref:carbamoyltransferase HypF n=1 Tax=Aliisedimentitalea sp. MJ-SS2 TaxID=3049795 RepID=UPI002907A1BF|nr:carbamoyltransferase HypF [Alisedimentitalea sp. MJ-SS2]MDU8929664.1 carbamoyltransferase HypF [Alisedimentitalea sp. MJ-SS2]